MVLVLQQRRAPYQQRALPSFPVLELAVVLQVVKIVLAAWLQPTHFKLVVVSPVDYLEVVESLAEVLVAAALFEERHEAMLPTQAKSVHTMELSLLETTRSVLEVEVLAERRILRKVAFAYKAQRARITDAMRMI